MVRKVHQDNSDDLTVNGLVEKYISVGANVDGPEALYFEPFLRHAAKLHPCYVKSQMRYYKEKIATKENPGFAFPLGLFTDMSLIGGNILDEFNINSGIGL